MVAAWEPGKRFLSALICWILAEFDVAEPGAAYPVLQADAAALADSLREISADARIVERDHQSLDAIDLDAQHVATKIDFHVIPLSNLLERRFAIDADAVETAGKFEVRHLGRVERTIVGDLNFHVPRCVEGPAQADAAIGAR